MKKTISNLLPLISLVVFALTGVYLLDRISANMYKLLGELAYFLIFGILIGMEAVRLRRFSVTWRRLLLFACPLFLIICILWIPDLYLMASKTSSEIRWPSVILAFRYNKYMPMVFPSLFGYAVITSLFKSKREQ